MNQHLDSPVTFTGMETELGKTKNSFTGPCRNAFTLVEALVVASIMAILAAVAIPMYLGFVDSQRKSSVKSLAGTAAIQANVMWRRGITPTNALVKSSLFLPDPSAYNVVVIDGDGIVIVIDAQHPTISDTATYQ